MDILLCWRQCITLWVKKTKQNPYRIGQWPAIWTGSYHWLHFVTEARLASTYCKRLLQPNLTFNTNNGFVCSCCCCCKCIKYNCQLKPQSHHERAPLNATHRATPGWGGWTSRPPLCLSEKVVRGGGRRTTSRGNHGELLSFLFLTLALPLSMLSKQRRAWGEVRLVVLSDPAF